MENQESNEIVDLTLTMGQLLLQSGAEALRVAQTMRYVGTALGCEEVYVSVLPDSLTLTTQNNSDFRTKVRQVERVTINLNLIAEINELSRQVTEGKLDRLGLTERLENIENECIVYNRWLVVLFVGLACGSFSRLFGGDWACFFVTAFSSSIAMIFRQSMESLRWNNYLIVLITAFIASFGASTAVWFSPIPEAAIGASVVLLIPGIALVNSIKDFMRGYVSVGVARIVQALLVLAAIVQGLFLALGITGGGL